MTLQELLFPQLKDKRWAYVNIDEEARATKLEGPLLVADVLKRMNADCFYGGYMEDRNYIMRECYQKPREAWHLGIDYFAPEWAEVHLPVDATLIHAHRDDDQDGGWGGKLIFELRDKRYLILGHLVPRGIFPMIEIGKRKGYRIECKAGDVVGAIGPYENNGGWYPHLHVQVCNSDVFPASQDGYSYLFDEIDIWYPRPETILEPPSKPEDLIEK